MKWLIVFCLFLSGCQKKTIEVKPQSETLRLAIASDLHYYSSQLHDDGERFQMMLANGDGKMVELIEEVSDALVDQLIEDQVDALILSGDLTLNGEKLSHEDLSKKLHQLEEKGIDVFVIPGNHDIDSNYCFKFEKDDSEKVESVTAKQFKKIYKEFYRDVISQDKESLSIIAPLREDIWLMMLDSNSNTHNSFDESTWQWIEEQLQIAQEENKQVISVTHQGSMIHHPAFVHGYVIQDNKRLLELFEQYHVKMNFSGHLHVQHIDSSNQVVDIANASAAVSPNLYSDVVIDENQFVQVQSKSILVSDWAKKQGITDERLLNYESYAKAYFMNTNSWKLTRDLEEYPLTREDIDDIRTFVSELNYAYFAGSTSLFIDEALQMPGYQKWRQLKEETRFDDYMEFLLKEDEIETAIQVQL